MEPIWFFPDAAMDPKQWYDQICSFFRIVRRFFETALRLPTQQGNRPVGNAPKFAQLFPPEGKQEIRSYFFPRPFALKKNEAPL